ncbi:MAG: MFS transporter [Neisseriaceae bacterium]
MIDKSKDNRYNLMTLCFGQTNMMINLKVNLMISSLLALSFGVSSSITTLPSVFMTIAIPFGVLLASLLFKKYSIRSVHLFGISLSLIAMIFCAYSTISHTFMILIIGGAIIGVHAGIGWYYRYNAADISIAERKNTSISYIILAGVPAAIFGPLIADKTKYLLHNSMFLGTFIVVALINCLTFILFMFIKINYTKSPPSQRDNTLITIVSIKQILLQRKFVVGTLATGLCYLIMTQVMVATPLAMSKIYHYSLSNITLAMQLHFLGMFLTSLFTGRLINKYGLKPVMLIGISTYFICSAVIILGTKPINFYIGLLLLGIGWNFIFISGTSLIVQSQLQHNGHTVQSVNNFITSVLSGVGALLAGPLLFTLGWTQLNIIVLPFSGILLLIAVLGL